MTLTELKNAIDRAVQYEKNPERINVVISTKLPFLTCGARPSVGVKHANMGFDWEANQFRLTPMEELMEIKHDVHQIVMEWDGNYYCPKCEKMLSKRFRNNDIRFCWKCGQAVKWE